MHTNELVGKYGLVRRRDFVKPAPWNDEFSIFPIAIFYGGILIKNGRDGKKTFYGSVVIFQDSVTAVPQWMYGYISGVTYVLLWWSV